MNFKKSQSGRSMVEMLGVLAIIGVLSVGGIAGYSLSMRRHRANQIVDVMAKYALVGYSQCQQKLLNGEVSGLRECNSHESDTAPNKIALFTEAGVGPLPAGVTGVYSLNIVPNATTGIDTVILYADIPDKKLCQAVASIAGTGCSSGIWFEFKQN